MPVNLFAGPIVGPKPRNKHLNLFTYVYGNVWNTLKNDYKGISIWKEFKQCLEMY